MSDLGTGLAADPAADVQGPGVDRDRPESHEGDCDSPTPRFTAGQRVELAVQVGSWKEGTPCTIVKQEPLFRKYEWRVTVHRDAGDVDAFLYEHELRPAPSRLEKLCARVSGWEENPDYPGSGLPKPVDYVEFCDHAKGECAVWGKFGALADGEAVSSADGPGTDAPWSSVPRDPFGAAVDALYTEAQDLLLRKHQDYGPKNISQAPGGALNGLRVRMWDKLARLNHLTSEDADPNFEGLRDTLLDLANYALIGCLVLDGDWPSGD